MSGVDSDADVMSLLMKWLEEGSEEPETIVDLKWAIYDVKKDDNGKIISFRASTVVVPVRLLVLDMGDDPPAVRFVIETPIETIDYDIKRKAKIYRAMLLTSRAPLVKFYLYGEEQLIGIAADLDKRSIRKKEVSDALSMLVFSLKAFIDRVNDEEINELIAADALEVLIELARKYVSEGKSRDELIEYLVRSGLDREIAEEIARRSGAKSRGEGPILYK